MNADIRKAHKRYTKAVQKLEAAALAQWEQEALVRVVEAGLALRKDLVRELSADVEVARDALIEAAGRAS